MFRSKGGKTFLQKAAVERSVVGDDEDYPGAAAQRAAARKTGRRMALIEGAASTFVLPYAISGIACCAGSPVRALEGIVRW